MTAIYSFPNLIQAKFVQRINRYLVEVTIEKTHHFVHLHDPGRLEELLFDQNELLLSPVSSNTRKTKFDIIAAKLHHQWILIHSGYHRKIAEAFFKTEYHPFPKESTFQAEVKIDQSRLDFLCTTFKEKIYIEQKGCTLALDDIATFPDAPTLRGVKHLRELITIKKAGTRSALLIFVYVSSKGFTPHTVRDPLFSSTFFEALERGVELYLYEFSLSFSPLSHTATLHYCHPLPLLK